MCGQQQWGDFFRPTCQKGSPIQTHLEAAQVTTCKRTLAFQTSTSTVRSLKKALLKYFREVSNFHNWLFNVVQSFFTTRQVFLCCEGVWSNVNNLAKDFYVNSHHLHHRQNASVDYVIFFQRLLALCHLHLTSSCHNLNTRLRACQLTEN